MKKRKRLFLLLINVLLVNILLLLLLLLGYIANLDSVQEVFYFLKEMPYYMLQKPLLIFSSVIYCKDFNTGISTHRCWQVQVLSAVSQLLPPTLPLPTQLPPLAPAQLPPLAPLLADCTLAALRTVISFTLCSSARSFSSVPFLLQ